MMERVDPIAMAGKDYPKTHCWSRKMKGDKEWPYRYKG
jgi:hypothetical protein